MKQLTPALRLQLVVWAVAACFLAALAVAVTWASRNMYQRQLDESQIQVEHFVAGAGEAFNRSILGVDVLLASSDEILGLASYPQSWSGGIQGSALLHTAARHNLLVRQITVLDGQGRVLASSGPAGPQALLSLPEAFLAELRTQPVPQLVMSELAVSFASSERMIYVGRSLPNANGELLLAVAEIPVTMLMPVVMQSVAISGLEVTLERSDGALLLSESPTPGHKGKARPLQVGSQWQQPARVTQASALVVAYPTLYPEVWISASLPEAAALLGSANELRMVQGFGLLLAAMILATAALTLVHLRRMHTARHTTARARQILEEALGSMTSGFLLIDAQRNVVQWNARLLELYPTLSSVALAPGIAFSSLFGTEACMRFPDAGEDERRAWVRRHWNEWETQPPAEGRSRELQLPGGIYVQVTEQPTPDGGRVLTFHDITQMRQASQEIENLAFYDPLTGLPNRRLLLDRLEQAVAMTGRTQRRGALLFLDLDHFKVLNDSRGHEVGDLLLKEVAQRLRKVVRSCDTVARLGGDEFVVMLCELSTEQRESAAQAQRVGSKIFESLGKPYQLAGQSHRSTCSIGAVLFGPDQVQAADLLKQADIAMYQVKARHGNGLCFFDPQMQVDISARAQMEADLQTALSDNQFELHYQPQYNVHGQMIGAEALLRWHHPERGMIFPGAFIGVAEHSGLIVPMGLWALRQACAQLCAWQHHASCAHLQVSVNVSARQFRHPEFVAQVEGELRRSGAPAHLLKLELTESLVLDDVQDSIAKMQALRNKGVMFAMDDFGTGHSSLAYLTQLPLQQLKIDQSFVRHIGKRRADDVIVQTIIAMARTLDLEVIAEGVETVQQHEFLSSHGCFLYQGYLLGRPMPAQQLQAQAMAGLAPEAVPS